jgi:hypothetical protein
MLETTGSIWDMCSADAVCVTTNGMLNKKGEAVMGKGIALEAKQRFTGVEKVLGALIKAGGNSVYPLPFFLFKDSGQIVSFPTKHHWRDKSSIDLIKVSCFELINLTDDRGWGRIVLPRPGCGLGGLSWANVKKEIEKILDDRFIVVTTNEKIN